MTLDDLTKSSGEWLRGTGPESDIVMCSRIRLARNLADFPFTNRASRSEKTEIEAHFRSSLSNARLDLTYLDVNTLGILDRTFLVERQIISRELANGDGPRGVAISTARERRHHGQRGGPPPRPVHALGLPAAARSGRRSTSSTTGWRSTSPTPSAPSSAT